MGGRRADVHQLSGADEVCEQRLQRARAPEAVVVTWYEYQLQLKKKMHEDAVNRSQLRSDSNGQRTGSTGSEAGDSGVRETVPVQRNHGDFYVRPDGSLEEHPGAGREPNLREKADISALALKCMFELGAARNSLCRLLVALDSCNWPTGGGDVGSTVHSGGLGGLGAGSELRVQGTPGPVAEPSMSRSDTVDHSPLKLSEGEYW